MVAQQEMLEILDPLLGEIHCPKLRAIKTEWEGPQIPALTSTIAKVPAAKVPAAKIPAAKIPEVKIPEVKVPAAKVPTVKVPSAEVPSANRSADCPSSEAHHAATESFKHSSLSVRLRMPISQYRRRICLIDAPDKSDLASLWFRQVGAEVDYVFGCRHTGRRLVETYQGDWSKVENQYRVCMLTERPHLVRARMSHKSDEGRRYVYERLLLPYSKSGQGIDRFLAAFTFYPTQAQYGQRNTLPD